MTQAPDPVDGPLAGPPPGSPPGPLRLRFLRHHRIVSGAHFQRAYKQGSRARGDLLIVVAVPNGLGHPRLGLSVGKRIWKSAVKRNRVRRIFRESFRLHQHELPADYDLVLIPAAPALDPALAATGAELVRLAKKAAQRYRSKAEEQAPRL